MQDDRLLRPLDPEEIRERATANGHLLLVTDERLVVGSHDHIVLDVAITGLRRIQFDIELERPATLVIVPLNPRHEPQVIVARAEEYEAVARALVFIGLRMHAASDTDTDNKD